MIETAGISLLVVIILLGGFWFAFWHGRKDHKKDPENIQMIQNTQEALKKGKITEEDAKVILESVNGK
jgi:flagellar basal body-associated protein FliL